MKRMICITGLLFSLISQSLLAESLRQLSNEKIIVGGRTLNELREQTGDLLSGAQGILVSGVVSGSQADVAGVQPGDIIISYDGVPIYDQTYFVALIARLSSIKKTVDIIVIRDSKKKVVKTETGKLGLAVNSVAYLGTKALSGADLSMPAEASKPETFVQLGFPGNPLSAIALSPDGSLALSGSMDSALKLWDVSSGREIRTFHGHTGIVTSVAFSANGRYALSGSNDKSLRLWEVATGKLVYTYIASSEVTSVAISPDGKQVLFGSYNNVALIDLATAANVRAMNITPGQAAIVNSVAISPDGRQALSASLELSQGRRDLLQLWDIASGQNIRTMTGHSGTIKSVAFSPDGKYAASGGDDKNLKLWDLSSGEETHSMTASATVSVGGVAFSPDGRHVLSAGSELRLWDVTTGEMIQELRTGPDSAAVFYAVAFSPDGRQILSGTVFEMLLWDVVSSRHIRRFRGNSLGLTAVAFSPDGGRVLSGGDDVSVWRLASGKREMHTSLGDGKYDGTLSIIFSPDGNQILSGHYDKTLKLRDARTGKLIRSFEGHSGIVTSLAFSPDGRKIISSGGGVLDSIWKGIPSTQFDGSLRLWDVETGENTLTLEGHSSAVQAIALSPDGKQLLSASVNEVKLWDLGSGTVLRTFPGGTFSGFYQAVAFSPDGHYALIGASQDKTVKLLDLGTGQEVRSFKGHTNFIMSVAFSPDGKLALSGSRGNSVKLWDVATGKELRTMKGHSGGISSVAFSPDGRLVLSGGQDSTARVWDVATGREVVQMISFRDGEWMSITPDGYFSASSPQASRNLNIRMGQQVYGIDQFFDVFYRPDIVEASLAGKDTSNMVTLTIDDAIKNPPPELLSVETLGASDASQIKVAYRIKSNGGGIGEVRVFHNGKLVQSDGVSRSVPNSLLGKKANQITSEELVSQMRSLAIAASRDASLKKPVLSSPKPDLYESVVEVEPIPGENEISVVAFNAQNSIQSVARTVNFTSSKAVVAPQLYILAIGIDEYKDKSSSLKFAVKDSLDISATWKTQAANIYGEKNIFVETISNAQATRAGILARIDGIAARVKPTDHFILFVASHGVLLGEQYFMVTSDYNGKLTPSELIGANEIVDFSKRIKSLSQLYILDTCHAGGIGGVVSGLYDARVSVLAKKMGLHVFAAASSIGGAIDGYKDNGLFTHTLLAGLNNNKQADANSDEKVSLMEIGRYSGAKTSEIAKQVGYKQDPLIINFGSDNPVYRLH